MNRSIKATQFADLIEKATDATLRLRNILREETDVLAKRELQALGEVIQQKITVLNEVESIDRERVELINLSGFSNTKDGIDSFLNKEVADTKIQNRWQALMTLVKECHAMNAANGKLVAQQERAVNRIITELTGQKAPDQNNAYTSKGTKTAELGGREISQA